MGAATGSSHDFEARRNEAFLIFMPGHETPAITLTWALYLLAKAPRVEAVLHNEVDRMLGGHPTTHDDLTSLAMTRPALKEHCAPSRSVGKTDGIPGIDERHLIQRGRSPRLDDVASTKGATTRPTMDAQ